MNGKIKFFNLKTSSCGFGLLCVIVYNMKTKTILAIFAFLSILNLAFCQDALSMYRNGRSFESAGLIEAANTSYGNAVDTCRAELLLNPRNIESYVVMCWSLYRMGKYSEVVTESANALKINPNEMRIIENLGETYFYLENYSESIRNLEKYVDTMPNGDRAGTAYFFLGEIYRITGKPQHADIAYTHAVKKEPSNALWWYRCGLAREKAGNKESAKTAFQSALKLRPTYTAAQQALNRLS